MVNVVRYICSFDWNHPSLDWLTWPISVTYWPGDLTSFVCSGGWEVRPGSGRWRRWKGEFSREFTATTAADQLTIYHSAICLLNRRMHGSTVVSCHVFCVHVCLLHVWFVSVLFVPSVLWYCWLGLLTCKNPYNLYCVGGDVKHCSIQSNVDRLDFLRPNPIRVIGSSVYKLTATQMTYLLNY